MLAKMLLAYSFIHSFIHSGYFYSVSSSPILLRSAPCELATVNEGLVQGNYVAARAGVEPTILRPKIYMTNSLAYFLLNLRVLHTLNVTRRGYFNPLRRVNSY